MQTIEVSLKTPHPAQRTILRDRKRFNVLKCGRRFGKTELAGELISENIERGEFVAYFSPTYKDLFEVWQEVKRTFKPITTSVSETVKQLTFYGGGKLDMWSMEDPDSGRGRKYHRVIIDECEKARKFREAWQESIRATLTDYAGDAYLISSPKVGETYFKSLGKLEATMPDWKTFVFTTYDNPHIDPLEIEQARLLLPKKIFDCEYLAMDVDGSADNPFLHQFDRDHHVSEQAVFSPDKKIILSIDFNLQPFACQFSHFWEDAKGFHDHTFDEIEIKQGSIPAMADEILLRYSAHKHKIEITGDYMGNRGDIGQRDNSSLYLQLVTLLGIPKQNLRLSPNPTHENSKADCNMVLWRAKQPTGNAQFIVHPQCKNTVFDLANVQWDDLKGSIVKRDRSDISQRSDQLDATRYRINHYWKPILKRLR